MLKRFSILSLFGALIVCFTSCKTVSSYQSDSDFLSCRVEVKVPRQEKGYDKIQGVVRQYKDKFIRISLRAPVVKSEVALIEYSPNGVMLINRRGKLYSYVESPHAVKIGGYKMLDMVEMGELLNRAAKSRSYRNISPKEIGLGFIPTAQMELQKFSSAPFQLTQTQLSKKYTLVSLEEFIDALFD